MEKVIKFGEKSISCITVTGEKGEVLAVIAPDEIIEKEGYRVALIN